MNKAQLIVRVAELEQLNTSLASEVEVCHHECDRLTKAIDEAKSIAPSTRVGSGSQRAPAVLSEYRQHLAVMRQKALDSGKSVLVMARLGERHV